MIKKIASSFAGRGVLVGAVVALAVKSTIAAGPDVQEMEVLDNSGVKAYMLSSTAIVQKPHCSSYAPATIYVSAEPVELGSMSASVTAEVVAHDLGGFWQVEMPVGYRAIVMAKC